MEMKKKQEKGINYKKYKKKKCENKIRENKIKRKTNTQRKLNKHDKIKLIHGVNTREIMGRRIKCNKNNKRKVSNNAKC